MPLHPRPAVTQRKEPQQDRSRRMRERILEAALRVLQDEGALGFTTTRVAEEARISVGSLYQYFPNKHALVVAIHTDAVRAGWDHVRAILDDRPSWSARRKLTEIARWFFATESSEATELGAVFNDVEVFLEDRTGHDPVNELALERFMAFVRSSSTRRRSAAALRLDTELLMTTLESVGKAVAARRLPASELDAWARATATMLCDHLALDR